MPACGPYHLYELVENTSQPIAPMSTGACGVRCTPSITTLAPAAWAAAVMAVMSGIVPIAFDAPVTATQRVRSVNASAIEATGRRPAATSNSTNRTAAPVSSATCIHGETLESWSRRVQTSSSPGRRSRPIARESENTLAVVDGPNTKPPGSPPSSRPSVPWTSATSASQASAAANWPWLLALLPLRCHAAVASIAESTTCVPAGPSKRAHPWWLPSVTAGKRARRSSTPTLWHTEGRRLPAAARSPKPDRVMLGGAGGVDEQLGERRVRCDRQRLGKAVADDLVIDESAVRGPVDVGEQPSVVVAGDDVTLEPHAAAHHKQLAGVLVRLVTEALGRVRRAIAERGVGDLGRVDADQPHPLLATADIDVDRVPVDDRRDDRVGTRRHLVDTK